MGENGKRRKWRAEEKLRIVLAGLAAGVEISDLCRREGINPTQYYTWRKQLMGSAGRVFVDKADKPDAREQRQEAELMRMKSVIAEITAENLDLKKRLRIRGPGAHASGDAGKSPRRGASDAAA